MSGVTAKSPAKLTPTPEQEDVIAAAGQPESVMVTAYAGCSKSTTLEMASKKIKVPALALAFNKTIAKELEGRMGGNFSVKTINGLGHGAWMRSIDAKIVLEPQKLGKLVTSVSKGAKVQLLGDQWDSVRKLTSAAMQAGIVLNNGGQGLTEDTIDNWRDLSDDLMILGDEFEVIYELARQVLHESVEMARSGIISFDDQVYCPTVLGGKWAKFPVVFVDESQDLSPLNHRMLELSLRDDESKLLAVGDPKQAIYSFRGADSNSMAKIEGLRQHWLKRPLATTFRCPKVIVARQQQHAPGFRAWHTNAEGEFRQLGQKVNFGTGEKEGWTFAEFQALLPSAQPAVLCRNNGPLMGLAFKLIRRGIGPVMLGRDIGKGLVSLSKKIAPEDNLPAVIVAGKITEWQEREADLATANGRPDKLASITDRAECLRAVLNHAEVKDAGQLRLMLEKLFAREHGQVTLSSIHKSKGLEWGLVLHLDPWRLPSKWARKAADKGDMTQMEQEMNLKYVAETRSKHTLVEANLEDFR